MGKNGQTANKQSSSPLQQLETSLSRNHLSKQFREEKGAERSDTFKNPLQYVLHACYEFQGPTQPLLLSLQGRAVVLYVCRNVTSLMHADKQIVPCHDGTNSLSHSFVNSSVSPTKIEVEQKPGPHNPCPTSTVLPRRPNSCFCDLVVVRTRQQVGSHPEHLFSEIEATSGIFLGYSG